MLILAAFLLLSNPAADSVGAKKKYAPTVTEVLRQYTDQWMKIRGVVGTGESRRNDKPCIVVFVETETSTIRKRIPKTVEGFDVVIEVTGTIRAQEVKYKN